MTATHNKLAASLKALHALQKDGGRVFQSRQLKRIDRERLLKHGFLQEIMKGWLISASPESGPGDSTPWFASFWDFCRRYLDRRFADEWYLSPEQSLLLHAENTIVPKQLIVYSPRGSKNLVDLPFGTSLYDLQVPQMPPAGTLVARNGLRLFSPTASLTKVPEAFFSRFPIEAEVVLASIREPSRLLTHLLAGAHVVVAGRLSGAFRRTGRGDVADEIVAAMMAADHSVRESDPFEPDRILAPRSPSPIVGRLEALWASAREVVLCELPRSSGAPENHDRYLKKVDGIYRHDAYHSLSIEGYQVTPDLIARVAAGAWDPDRDPHDQESKNALAARGYWLAFQRVRASVKQVLTTGDSAAAIVRRAHRDWYREMFRPQVAVGLLDASMLAGYRNIPVYLRGSRHVPPRWEILQDAMPALFDAIENEPEPAVQAVLGHWLFGYIHPFPDGNGRMARFLMNTLFAAGGYPWTVIRVEARAPYLAALEAASVEGDVRPFARFIAKQMR